MSSGFKCKEARGRDTDIRDEYLGSTGETKDGEKKSQIGAEFGSAWLANDHTRSGRWGELWGQREGRLAAKKMVGLSHWDCGRKKWPGEDVTGNLELTGCKAPERLLQGHLGNLIIGCKGLQSRCGRLSP